MSGDERCDAEECREEALADQNEGVAVGGGATDGGRSG